MDIILPGIKKFTVQQVADMLGLYRGTVINYEKKGIFPPVKRNPINGYREYTEDDIKYMRDILEGNTN